MHGDIEAHNVNHHREDRFERFEDDEANEERKQQSVADGLRRLN